jgi:hypothetical protein
MRDIIDFSTILAIRFLLIILVQHPMDFAKPIDESTESPSIPEKVRRFILKHLHGVHSIAIKEQKAGAKSFKQLNKINLRNKKGEVPSEDVEEICAGIMRIIEKRDEERDEGDPLVNFQIQASIEGKTSGPKHPSIEYEFDPVGFHDDGVGMYDDELNNPYQHVIDSQNAYISSLHYHLDESHTAIREIANNNNQALKPLMDALGWMGSFYASGLQNQQVALSMIYDVKKVEAEERGKTARTDKMMSMLEKPLGAMGAQFMPWAMSKMSGKKPPPFVPPGATDDEGEDDDDEGEDGPSAADTEASTEGGVQLTEDQKSNPVAAIASTVAVMLEPEQWFEISDILRKKEFRILRAVLGATEDEACMVAYDQFAAVDADKLLKLNAVLTEEQREMLTHLGKLIDSIKEQRSGDA